MGEVTVASNPAEKHRDIDQKLRLYGVFQAFANGNLPDNQQIDSTLAYAEDHSPIDLRKLSPDGQQLVEDFRDIIGSARELIAAKNPDELIQDTIYASSQVDGERFRDDIKGGADAAGANPTRDKEIMKNDGKQAAAHIKTLVHLFLTNGEVRKLVKDAGVVGRQLFATGASRAADQANAAAERAAPNQRDLDRVDQSAAESGDVPDLPSTPLRKGNSNGSSNLSKEERKQQVKQKASQAGQALKGKAQEAYDDIPEEQRQKFIQRLKKAVVDLQQEDGYEEAMTWLLDTFDKYKGHATNVTQGAAQGATSNSEVQSVTEDWITILERFANNTPLTGVRNSVDQLYADSKNDKQLHHWWSQVSKYVRAVLLKPGYVVSDDAAQAGDQLMQQGRQFFEGRYKGHWDHMFDELTSWLKQFNNDPLNNQFGEDWKRLTKDLLFDADGKLAFKPELWQDIRQVILPSLIKHLGYFPIPRAEYTDDKLDLVIDNVVLSGPNLFPNQIILDNRNHFSFSPYSQIQDRSFNTVRIALSQIQADMRDLRFAFRKKTGFPKLHDRGLADVVVSGEGISVDIQIEVVRPTRRDEIFRVSHVKTHVDELSFKIRDSKHDTLYKFIKPAAQAAIKKALSKAMNEGIRSGLEWIDSELVGVRGAIDSAQGDDNLSRQDALKQLFAHKKREAEIKKEKAEIKKQERGAQFAIVTSPEDELIPGALQDQKSITNKALYQQRRAVGNDHGWRSPAFTIVQPRERSIAPGSRRDQRVQQSALAGGAGRQQDPRLAAQQQAYAQQQQDPRYAQQNLAGQQGVQGQRGQGYGTAVGAGVAGAGLGAAGAYAAGHHGQQGQQQQQGQRGQQPAVFDPKTGKYENQGSWDKDHIKHAAGTAAGGAKFLPSADGSNYVATHRSEDRTVHPDGTYTTHGGIETKTLIDGKTGLPIKEKTSILDMKTGRYVEQPGSEIFFDAQGKPKGGSGFSALQAGQHVGQQTDSSGRAVPRQGQQTQQTEDSQRGPGAGTAAALGAGAGAAGGYAAGRHGDDRDSSGVRGERGHQAIYDRDGRTLAERDGRVDPSTGQFISDRDQSGRGISSRDQSGRDQQPLLLTDDPSQSRRLIADEPQSGRQQSGRYNDDDYDSSNRNRNRALGAGALGAAAGGAGAYAAGRHRDDRDDDYNRNQSQGRGYDDRRNYPGDNQRSGTGAVLSGRDKDQSGSRNRGQSYDDDRYDDDRYDQRGQQQRYTSGREGRDNDNYGRGARYDDDDHTGRNAALGGAAGAGAGYLAGRGDRKSSNAGNTPLGLGDSNRSRNRYDDDDYDDDYNRNRSGNRGTLGDRSRRAEGYADRQYQRQGDDYYDDVIRSQQDRDRNRQRGLGGAGYDDEYDDQRYGSTGRNQQQRSGGLGRSGRDYDDDDYSSNRNRDRGLGAAALGGAAGAAGGYAAGRNRRQGSRYDDDDDDYDNRRQYPGSGQRGTGAAYSGRNRDYDDDDYNRSSSYNRQQGSRGLSGSTGRQGSRYDDDDDDYNRSSNRNQRSGGGILGSSNRQRSRNYDDDDDYNRTGSGFQSVGARARRAEGDADRDYQRQGDEYYDDVIKAQQQRNRNRGAAAAALGAGAGAAGGYAAGRHGRTRDGDDSEADEFYDAQDTDGHRQTTTAAVGGVADQRRGSQPYSRTRTQPGDSYDDDSAWDYPHDVSGRYASREQETTVVGQPTRLNNRHGGGATGTEAIVPYGDDNYGQQSQNRSGTVSSYDPSSDRTRGTSGRDTGRGAAYGAAGAAAGAGAGYAASRGTRGRDNDEDKYGNALDGTDHPHHHHHHHHHHDQTSGTGAGVGGVGAGSYGSGQDQSSYGRDQQQSSYNRDQQSGTGAGAAGGAYNQPTRRGTGGPPDPTDAKYHYPGQHDDSFGRTGSSGTFGQGQSGQTQSGRDRDNWEQFGDNDQSTRSYAQRDQSDSRSGLGAAALGAGAGAAGGYAASRATHRDGDRSTSGQYGDRTVSSGQYGSSGDRSVSGSQSQQYGRGAQDTGPTVIYGESSGPGYEERFVGVIDEQRIGEDQFSQHSQRANPNLSSSPTSGRTGAQSQGHQRTASGTTAASPTSRGPPVVTGAYDSNNQGSGPTGSDAARAYDSSKRNDGLTGSSGTGVAGVGSTGSRSGTTGGTKEYTGQGAERSDRDNTGDLTGRSGHGVTQSAADKDLSGRSAGSGTQQSSTLGQSQTSSTGQHLRQGEQGYSAGGAQGIHTGPTTLRNTSGTGATTGSTTSGQQYSSSGTGATSGLSSSQQGYTTGQSGQQYQQTTSSGQQPHVPGAWNEDDVVGSRQPTGGQYSSGQHNRTASGTTGVSSGTATGVGIGSQYTSPQSQQQYSSSSPSQQYSSSSPSQQYSSAQPGQQQYQQSSTSSPYSSSGQQYSSTSPASGGRAGTAPTGSSLSARDSLSGQPSSGSGLTSNAPGLTAGTAGATTTSTSAGNPGLLQKAQNVVSDVASSVTGTGSNTTSTTAAQTGQKSEGLLDKAKNLVGVGSNNDTVTK